MNDESMQSLARRVLWTREGNGMKLSDETFKPMFLNLVQAAPPIKTKALNEKAMTVRLITKKPTTSHKDEEAEKVAQDTLGDYGISASTKLFKDPTNPIRQLLNEASAVYQYHKQHTLPYIDRGPRLLPVAKYEDYRDSMRVLVGDVETALARTMPYYDTYVQQDIDFRNRPNLAGVSSNRAKATDYPTAMQFNAAFDLQFTFAPLPDNSHWLFDVSEEDKAALTEQTMEIYTSAVADMYARIKKPLDELVSSLNVTPGIDPITGKRIGIFRDTKVTNVVDALANVRELCMGDEGVVAACDLLGAALPPALTGNIDVLRESPVVREAAAKKLAEVASKMGAFFGGN